jgi:hypothetical protein
MVAKPHRTNSDFQLRYFLAGACHTPDGAWALLYGQKIDIEGKLKHAEAHRWERYAKIAAANECLANIGVPLSARMQARAEIIKAEADIPVWELNLKAAKQELATIVGLMAELEPQRKYAHLPLLEATEAAQREEWLGEFKERAENFLVTQGTIPHDHLAHMRYHPDWTSDIVPHIQDLMVKVTALRAPSDAISLLAPPE